MTKFTEGLGLILGGITLIIFIAVLMALPTMLLWNACLVPAVDGVHEIGFLQALGLNILFSIMFKSSSKSSKNA